jgi:hypothetical protein
MRAVRHEIERLPEREPWRDVRSEATSRASSNADVVTASSSPGSRREPAVATSTGEPDEPEVGVAEARRVLQPVSEETGQTDVPEPDER